MSDAVANVVDRFLTDRRALGRKYLSEQSELALLVRFADTRGVENLQGLTSELLDEFLASRPRTRPRSFNHLLGVVAVFLDWAVRLLTEGLELVGAAHLSPRHRSPARWHPWTVYTQVASLIYIHARSPETVTLHP